MNLWTTLVLAVCCGVVIASANGASAAPSANGLSYNSLSHNGLGKADAFTDRASQPLAATQAEPSTVRLPRQVELANPDLASTAVKRQQLTYLVQCALSEDVVLYTEQGAERFTFQRQMGLAPRWLSEALTPREERWVSACLLARVNYFGKRVIISLRATPAPVPALEPSDDEQQTFSIFEGGFFGNLFLPNPVAYTCQGERTPAQAVDPIFQDRICTKETGATTADGTPITYCRFLMTGPCEDDQSFTVDGTRYSEVVFTYLRPGQQE